VLDRHPAPNDTISARPNLCDSAHAPRVRRINGTEARVIAVPARRATPQDTGVGVFAGLASYVLALPVMAAASCVLFALGSL